MVNIKDDKPNIESHETLVKTGKVAIDESVLLAKVGEEKERSFEESLANNSDTEMK